MDVLSFDVQDVRKWLKDSDSAIDHYRSKIQVKLDLRKEGEGMNGTLSISSTVSFPLAFNVTGISYCVDLNNHGVSEVFVSFFFFSEII